MPGPARLSYAVGRLDRVLGRALRELLAPHGLSLPEYTTLSVIAAGDGLSNAQLARRSLITPQSMNEVLIRLERQELVRRSAGPAPGRAMPTEITPAGVRALAACERDVDLLEARMLEGLDAAAADELRVSLLLLARALEQDAAA